MSARSGLFLWRAGVLTGGDPRSAAEVELCAGAAATLARLAARGVAVVVCAPTATGLDAATAGAISARINALLAAAGAQVDLHQDYAAADLRLGPPRPALILRAARTLALDLARSWVIGTDADHARAAAQAGCAGAVLVGGALPPADDLGIVVAAAIDLADAPRVMVPRAGGCWHDAP